MTTQPQKTVMIVDDREDMVSTLSDILEDHGYEVITAHDGHDALTCIQNSEVHLALIDIMMPGINGVETFKEIKRLSPHTSVIMMTAFAVEELIKDALQEGAYAVVYKPLDIEKLLSLIADSEAGPTILIVDDHQPHSDNVKEILGGHGYRVTTASSGHEAIEKVKEDKYDIVLLDIVMPGLNGEETFIEIKKIDPKASVIIYSGYEVEDIISRCLQRGVYAYLHKPFDPDRLLNILKKIAMQRGNGHPPSTSMNGQP